MSFTHETTTIIRFPSHQQFVAFRDDVEDRYDGRMVAVKRGAACSSGASFRGARGCVLATVHHSRGIGAELRGLAFGRYEGWILNALCH